MAWHIHIRRKTMSAFRTSIYGLGAAALFITGIVASPASALEGNLENYVFVPNRESADVGVIDTRTDQLIARIQVGNVPHQVAVSDTLGKLVASNTKDNTVSIIDLKTMKTTTTLSLGMEPEHMQISPSGGLIAVGNIEDGTVSMINLEKDKEIYRVSGLQEPHNLTFNPDGSLLYVGNLGANIISVINVASGKIVNEITVGEPAAVASLKDDGSSEYQGIINVTRTPDGRLGFAAYGEGDVMAVIDLRTQEKLGTVKLNETPWRAYTTADGRYMIVPNNGDNTVSVFSTSAPFKKVADLKGAEDMTGVNTGWFETTAFIISRGDDKIVMLDLMKMENAGEIQLPAGSSPETAVTSPDGLKIYVSLSGTNEVAVIDTRKRKLIKKISGVGKEPWGTFMVGSLNYCH